MEKKRSMLAHPLVVGVLAGFCCALWGSAAAFIKLGYREFVIGSDDTAAQLLFAGLRFFLAGAMTIAFTSLFKRKLVRPKAANWDKVVKLALVQTVAQYVLFYIGVAHSTSVKSSIIQGLNAFVGILIACFLFRSERMTGRKWLGGLLGVVGIVLVNFDGTGFDPSMSFIGEGFLLTSQIANGCSAGLIKIYGKQEDPVALSGWQFMVGGAALAITGFLMGGRLHPQSVVALGALLYLAFLSATAYGIWSVLLQVNPVSHVVVYTFLQPIFGVMTSLLLVESAQGLPFVRYGAALALVCLSIVVVNRGQKEKTA